MNLDELRVEGRKRLLPQEKGFLRFEIGFGTCGQVSGAREMRDALEEELADSGAAYELVTVGCNGLCWAEPLLAVVRSDGLRAVYRNVTRARVKMILKAELSGLHYDRALVEISQLKADRSTGIVSSRLLQSDRPSGEVRRVTYRCGWVSPSSVAEYAATGGYAALSRIVLNAIEPGRVVGEISASGLRGLGGAGFQTGEKLSSTLSQDDSVKYVICNADEGDPGAYMDRSILEGDPHAVIEGLAIEGYCLGAREGFVFVRSEYGLAVRTLQSALDEAYISGLLGERILGSDWSFDITVVRSGGSYVCGESSALVNALENKPGVPRASKHHLSEKGLWGHPTCLNNVETLANIPLIMRDGARAFRALGTGDSPGTKVFCVAACHERTGLAELPFGMPLDMLTHYYAKSDASHYKAVQIGGPSGVLLPAGISMNLDFEGLRCHDAIMGSGGIVFLSEGDCVIETVRYFERFLQSESCGRCKSCKEGLRELCDILDRIVAGDGVADDIMRLEELAVEIPAHSACGLGKNATNALRTALVYFRGEFESHLAGICEAHVCKSLMHFDIIDAKCPGCRCCLSTCPTNAMRGTLGKPFHINQQLCIKCWMCTSMCPYDAVVSVGGGSACAQ